MMRPKFPLSPENWSVTSVDDCPSLTRWKASPRSIAIPPDRFVFTQRLSKVLAAPETSCMVAFSMPIPSLVTMSMVHNPSTTGWLSCDPHIESKAGDGVTTLTAYVTIGYRNLILPIAAYCKAQPVSRKFRNAGYRILAAGNFKVSPVFQSVAVVRIITQL